LSGSWQRAAGNAVQSVQLFAIHTDLSLFSNFSYFLEDPVRGDQFNQVERRTILGGNAKRLLMLQAFGVEHVLSSGVQTRLDLIDGLGLHRTQKQVRLGTVREDDVRELGTGLFVEAESKWRPWLRSVVGVRGDAYRFGVTGDRAENSGRTSAGIVSPKASLILAPASGTELYLSGGLGFHSNDARGTTITVDPVSGDPAQRVDPLVRSRGAEVGVRATPRPRWRSTLALWALDLDSELLFVGDGGATEPSAASRRRGATFANFWRPTARLAIDADVSLARARFSGVVAGEERVPGALERVVASGIAWSPLSHGIFGALRLRHFGSYPLTEDNAVRAASTTLLSAEGGYQLRSGLRLRATVLNLLDARASDIQYFYRSRLAGESAAGVDDVHFHPVEPRQLRLSLVWSF
jgi:outer membrane receptor protein involved in Fe transport